MPTAAPTVGAVVMAVAMCSMTGATHGAPTPRNTHAAARMAMPAFMGPGTSFAWRATSERGADRNVTPYAFTKQVTASAPVMASATAPNAATTLMTASPANAVVNRDW